MLSHYIPFDCYRDLVKPAGQVFFLVKGEEINYSKGIHLSLALWRPLGASSWERPQVRHSLSSQNLFGEGKLFVFALFEGLFHKCTSKVVRPQALAEPGPPWCALPARSERRGMDDACSFSADILTVESDVGPGSLIPQCCPHHTSNHSCFVEAATGSLIQNG